LYVRVCSEYLVSSYTGIALRSESPSGKCAKLHTVATTNNRDTCRNHSIIACSHHIYMVLFFAHIPFMVNRTFSATPAGSSSLYCAVKRSIIAANILFVGM